MLPPPSHGRWWSPSLTGVDEVAGVHNLSISGLSALRIHVDAQRLENQQELSSRQFDRFHRVHRGVRQKAHHMVVRVQQRCKIELVV